MARRKKIQTADIPSGKEITKIETENEPVKEEGKPLIEKIPQGVLDEPEETLMEKIPKGFTNEVLEIHDLCNILPEMTKEEFDELKEDIEKNGLLNPIVLFENKVLDGRHRYRACLELGIEPRFIQFEGDRLDALSFVISENIKRRHLTPSQKAFAGVEIREKLMQMTKEKQADARKIGGLLGGRGRAKDSEKYNERKDELKTILEKIPKGTESAEIASKIVGTNEKYVREACKIREEAPELERLVIQGKITITDASKLARLDKDIRTKAIEMINNNSEDDSRTVRSYIKEAIAEKRKEILIEKSKEFESIKDVYKLYLWDITNIVFKEEHTVPIPDESVDLVITCPPFAGASYEPKKKRILITIPEETEKEVKKDNKEVPSKSFLTYDEFYKALGEFIKRALRPGGSAIIMVGQYYLPIGIEILSQFLEYQWTLMLYQPGPGVRIHALNMHANYKPLLWFKKETTSKSKAQKKLIPSDVIINEHIEKDLHEWDVSQNAIDKIVKTFANPMDVILDPFMMTGAVGIASIRNKCKFIGYERDEEMFKIAKGRIGEEYMKIKNESMENENDIEDDIF
ncbi:MAG: DNA methyltransferase [Nitrososphaeria archaeon]